MRLDRMSKDHVKRESMYVLYKTLAYVICSFTAAFGALMFLGRAPYAKSDYGQMWELDAIAAVVIGGTSLFGGRGSILGTFFRRDSLKAHQ